MHPSADRERLRQGVRHRPHLRQQRARHHHPAVHSADPVRRDDGNLHRRLVHRRPRPGPVDDRGAGSLHPSALRPPTPAPALGIGGRSGAQACGPCRPCPCRWWSSGGIYGGFFTPTEAAAVSVALAIIVEVLVHRDLGLGDLWDVSLETSPPDGQPVSGVGVRRVHQRLPHLSADTAADLGGHGGDDRLAGSIPSVRQPAAANGGHGHRHRLGGADSKARCWSLWPTGWASSPYPWAS